MKVQILIGVSLLAARVYAEEAPAVRTVKPAQSAPSARYQVPGRTEPIESATIFTRATGIINERKFEIGDAVQQGEVLATVSAPEVDRAVEAAAANVEQAKARASNATSLSNRSSRLLRSDVVSQEETEQRQSAAVESAAGVRVAEAELARLEEQQKFSTVRAPFQGVITARNFDRGDLVRGDSASVEGWLYQLARLDTLRFVIAATPDLALRLGKNAEVKVRFREFPGQDFSAKVAHASRVFDTGSGTMRVELLLENKDLKLPAGLTGSADFLVPPAPNTYTVPANTLLVREGRTYVVAAEENRVRFLEVEPGRNMGKDVEISSGQLSPGTLVILNPNAMLKEGDAITVAPFTASK